MSNSHPKYEGEILLTQIANVVLASYIFCANIETLPNVVFEVVTHS